ncbi:MAG: hypothetical protein Q4E41_03040 [Bacteroidales bacterium]|nr:hypothetical protein [Bacteroidales bacterium]
MDQESGGFWSKSEQKFGVSGVSGVSVVSCDSGIHDVCCFPSSPHRLRSLWIILFGQFCFGLAEWGLGYKKKPIVSIPAYDWFITTPLKTQNVFYY